MQEQLIDIIRLPHNPLTDKKMQLNLSLPLKLGR